MSAAIRVTESFNAKTAADDFPQKFPNQVRQSQKVSSNLMLKHSYIRKKVDLPQQQMAEMNQNVMVKRSSDYNNNEN
jgi:hypothetical protein